jgi:hypothetical protein
MLNRRQPPFALSLDFAIFHLTFSVAQLEFVFVPVTYAWDNSEKTAICYRLEGRWTWDEMYETLEESRKLWSSVNHMVDIIVDMNDSVGFPPGNTLGHFRNVSIYYSSSKVGNTAIVGANDFFRMALELFYKVYIRARQKPLGHTFLVKDMEAARAALADYRKKAQTGR